MSDINQRTLSIRVSRTSLDWNVTVPCDSTLVLSGRGTFVDGRGIAFTEQMFNKRFDLLELDAQIVRAAVESDAALVVDGVRARDHVNGAIRLAVPDDFFENLSALSRATTEALEVVVTFRIDKFSFSTTTPAKVPLSECAIVVRLQR